MKETQKPFDRREALQIFCAHLETGLTSHNGLKEAIRDAQDFNEMVKEANPGKRLRESIRADRKYGQFTPNGEDLYFLTNDGVKCLIATFPTIELCTLGCLAMSTYLDSAKEMEPKDTPKDLYPENASHLHLGGAE